MPGEAMWVFELGMGILGVFVFGRKKGRLKTNWIAQEFVILGNIAKLGN